MNQQREQNKKRVIGRLLCAAAVMLAVLGIGLRHTSAQSPLVAWSMPTDLSSTLQSSAYPAIVADDFGYVHVLWSEDTSGQPLGPQDPSYSGDTIFYTRWDGTTWTEPVDVLYLPDDSVATYVSVAADKQGYLHAVWTGNSNIYYSNAPVSTAESAHAWSPPMVITTNSARSAWESNVAVDNTGTVHVVYATRGSEVGVYHIASTDSGATWTEPVKISQPFDSQEISFSRVKIIGDNAGRLHAVWDTTNLEGFGQSIYYARSVDNGATWGPAVQMAYLNPGDFDVGWPYLATVGSDELHLIYNAAENVGRWERISRDGGASWNQAKFIIPEMEGINGYTIPLVDGNGQLHLIINMRPSTSQKVGIYYSDWHGDGWSPVTPLANEGPMAETAHYVAAAVLSGREIHVIWNQVRGGEVWHTQGTIKNAQPLSARSLPTMTPAPSPTPTPAVVVLESAPQQRLPVSQAITASGNSASSSPLIPGTAAAIVFIGMIAIRMWWRRWRSRAS